jgi:acyl-CoA thioester hydrolase
MDQPTPKTRVFETEVVVRSYDLDSFGHVNHAVYLNYLEAGRFDALREGGLSRAVMTENGWGVYVVRLVIDYLKEAHMDDRLVVRTRLAGFRRSSMVLSQEVARPREDDVDVIARAEVHAVWVGETGRPIRIPTRARTALGPGVSWSSPESGDTSR